MSDQAKGAPMAAAAVLVVGAMVVGALWGGGLPLIASSQTRLIEQQVILDSMKQLKTAIDAKRSPAEICVYARMVSAAMIQANDSAKLADFSKTEQRICSGSP